MQRNNQNDYVAEYTVCIREDLYCCSPTLCGEIFETVLCSESVFTDH